MRQAEGTADIALVEGENLGQLLDLSEALQAYKAIDEVIEAENDLVEPLIRLMPLAVLKG